MKTPLLILLAIVLAASVVDAQDEENPSEKLARLLDTVARHELTLEGRVRPESSAGDFGGVVIQGSGSAAEPFSGRMEVMRTKRGELLIRSEKVLPGFEIYDDGDRILTRALYEESPISLTQLASDLGRLVDPGMLATEIRKGGWQRAAAEDGGVTWTGKLPRRLIRSDGGVMGMMRAKVMEINASISLDAAGRLGGLTFAVVRSDPMAAMREMAASGDLGGGGGVVTSEDLEDMEDVAGDTTHYELEVAARPSKALTASLAAMRKVIALDD